jgi:hypothetical protein
MKKIALIFISLIPVAGFACVASPTESLIMLILKRLADIFGYLSFFSAIAISLFLIFSRKYKGNKKLKRYLIISIIVFIICILVISYLFIESSAKCRSMNF